MILSDEGIRRAIANGDIEIEPPPPSDHYSPSAVDIVLGAASTFRCWKLDALNAKGVSVVLDLSEQSYPVTAQHYSELAKEELDGTIILPPYSKVPQVMLCQTLQRIHLKPASK